MRDDELEPQKQQKKLRPLDKMSIAELEEYIQDSMIGPLMFICARLKLARRLTILFKPRWPATI